ncbi:type VI secretion protein, partial [Streptomyces sp. Mo3]
MTVTALVTGPVPRGPVVDFLTDPAAFWTSIARTVLGWAVPYMPVLVPVATAAVVCVTTACGRMRRRRQRRFADEARCVEILAPPQIPAKGGDVLWAQLAGLLRPWWRR